MASDGPSSGHPAICQASLLTRTGADDAACDCHRRAVQGVVKDTSGGIRQSIEIRMANPVSGFARTVATDSMGRFAFTNVPPNPDHVTLSAQGFSILRGADLQQSSGGAETRGVSNLPAKARRVT